MAESFENQDNILLHWAKDKVQKKSCWGIKQVREAGRRKIEPYLLEIDSEKNTRAVSVGSRTETKPITKSGSW